MALTLEESNVTLNETFNDLLDDLQSGILKHHGRQFAYHVFIQFNTDAIKNVKKWITSKIAPRIISAKTQLQHVQLRRLEENFDGGSIVVLALSNFGYKKLGFSEEQMPADPAFKQGMKKRFNDIADDEKRKEWERELTEDIDALIIVADSDDDTAKNLVTRIGAEMAHEKVGKVLYTQKGSILRNEHGVGIEHFGYADGVSQPLYLKEEIAAEGAERVWSDQSTLDILLEKDLGGATEDSYGSYLVFRKLEQKVKAFKDAEENLSTKFNNGQGIKDKNGDTNKELAGAMLVGRFEDGTPVILDSKEAGIKHEAQLVNDFNYSTDAHGSTTNGSKCPFHAHIRITNPRADVGDFAKTIRLTRRGIPYNDIGRNEQDLENDQPDFGVGLLFMCYQKSIQAQFEFIQKSWANDGDIGGRPVGRDSIIGQGNNDSERRLPAQWGVNDNLQLVPKTFKNFVTNKGGEYFFTPSISFLKSLK